MAEHFNNQGFASLAEILLGSPDANAAIWMGVALAIIAVTCTLAVLLRAQREAGFPVVPKPVLTRTEIAFYQRLSSAVRQIGGITVFPQVAMGAVIEVKKGIAPSMRQAVRNRFDRKIIDFTIVDSETNVLLLVELDDATHQTENDRKRDAITGAAGYPTMRIRGRASRDELEIERMLREHLAARLS